MKRRTAPGCSINEAAQALPRIFFIAKVSRPWSRDTRKHATVLQQTTVAARPQSCSHATDRGEHRQAAGALAPGDEKLSGAAAKKIKPQFSAVFGFLLLAFTFNVRSFMRQLTKAERALSM